MNNIVLAMAMVTISLTVGLVFLSMQYSYGQTANETSTFEDCFTDMMGLMTLGLVFAPTEKLGTADLLDPSWKTMVINMCNFYHEKSGKWVTTSDADSSNILEEYQPGIL